MKRLLLVLTWLVVYDCSFCEISRRGVLYNQYSGMVLSDSCVFDDITEGDILCDNIFTLIKYSGSIVEEMRPYDLTTWNNICHAIRMLDDTFSWNAGELAYKDIGCFYRTLNKQPGDFAKMLMRDFLFLDISKTPAFTEDEKRLSAYFVNHSYLTLAWEYLWGDIVPRDTLLGKLAFAYFTGTTYDSLENYMLPFWRENVSRQHYLNMQYSLIQNYLKNKPISVLYKRVIERGDTLAYKEIIKRDDWGDEIRYAIYMIDQYNYKPAYKDLYVCLKHYYDYFNLPM